MKSLKEITSRKKIVYAFGRMNPPTRGHEFLIKKLVEIATKENAEAKLYISHSQDTVKNPLTHSQKLKYLKLGIPESENIIVDSKLKNPFQVFQSLKEEGYTDVVFVVGEDRYNAFNSLIYKAINNPEPSPIKSFNSCRVEKVGTRNKEGNLIESISGTKMRTYVSQNDFNNFYKNCPSSLSEHFAKKCLN